MSSDPIAKILDTFYATRDEASRAVSSTFDTITESKTFRSLEHFVFGKDLKNTIRLTQTHQNRSLSVWEKTTSWISSHKWLTAAIVLGVSGGGAYSYLAYCKSRNIRTPLAYLLSGGNPRYRKKRRAKKAPNGARTEVVIISGSPSEPITRIIANDLDRRGFIVYWTTCSSEEEALVAREKSPDIRPLPIRSSDVGSVQKSTKDLSEKLRSPVSAFPGAIPHHLNLVGIIVVPDLYFPTGPVESLRLDSWTDMFYSKILAPTTLLSNGLLDLAREHQSRIIFATPSIMADIKPGFHSSECVAVNALSALALCLHRELKPQGIPVLHMKLGSFDVNHGRSQARQIANGIRADILSWSDNIRSLYAPAYQQAAYLQFNSSSGSNFRVLHRAIFDALTCRAPKRVWYVGKHAYTYHLLSTYMPESFITMLLQPGSSIPPHMDERTWERV